MAVFAFLLPHLSESSKKPEKRRKSDAGKSLSSGLQSAVLVGHRSHLGGNLFGPRTLFAMAIFFGNQLHDAFWRQFEQLFGFRQRGWRDLVIPQTWTVLRRNGRAGAI